MENYSVLTGKRNIIKLKKIYNLDDINYDKIVEFIKDDVICTEEELRENIEVIIPCIKNNDMFPNVNKDGLYIKSEYNFKIYDDFYSFKGTPYTKEADNYLSDFNKFDCVFGLPGRHIEFTVWYRNI